MQHACSIENPPAHRRKGPCCGCHLANGSGHHSWASQSLDGAAERENGAPLIWEGARVNTLAAIVEYSRHREKGVLDGFFLFLHAGFQSIYGFTTNRPCSAWAFLPVVSEGGWDPASKMKSTVRLRFARQVGCHVGCMLPIIELRRAASQPRMTGQKSLAETARIAFGDIFFQSFFVVRAKYLS